MAQITLSTKLDAQTAKDMKHFCLDKEIKIMAFLEAAIREKLDREKK